MQCLDVLRALSKEPGVLDVLFNELGDGHGDKRLAAHINRLQTAFKDTSDIQYRARQLTEDIALGLQAKLLLEAGNAAVSDAFIASRLGSAGRVYGALPRGLEVGSHCRAVDPQGFRSPSTYCGSEPARDSELPFNQNVGCDGLIASRLAPTGFLVCAIFFVSACHCSREATMQAR